MAMTIVNRRTLLAGLGALMLAPRAAIADNVTDLQWSDLLPDGLNAIPPSMQGLLGHDEGALPSSQQPQSSGVRTDWNGQVVSLPGFIVPIDYAGTRITAFILVPYVGACVHVPPPPPNQLVFVTAPTPYESGGMFEAVTVTGMFSAASTSTHLADIAYVLSADLIEPYRT